MPRLSAGTRARLRAHLALLYPGPAADDTLPRLVALLEGHRVAGTRSARSGRALFDETDVALITYPDQLREPGVAPLRTLADFLARRVAGAVSAVHLLPFYPATSDDGFAVADYRAVDPAVGDWGDVAAVGQRFDLMFDAVVNHTSTACAWFKGWLADEPDRRGFYRAVDPATDLSAVTRPRTSPLLTPFPAATGTRHVWTTFSADQADLDYATPDVLLAVTRVLLDYVAHGARILRLDAIAYLWKEIGTPCVHLPQTHEIVRLWRTVLDAVAPGTLLITETNVPHAENVSYFGDGADEAHLVYQFPLAPLVLSAFHLADTSTLQEWLAGVSTPSPTTAFFNFLSSHDGVGVRPAEGLLTPAEIGQLCRLARAHGGGVSAKADPGGRLSPYELNTVYFDALTEVDSREAPSRQVDRFLAAHSILLALAGVPGIYVQSLLGSRNWTEGVERTGQLRTINRQKFDRAALEAELDDPASLRHQVFTRLLDRIAVRTAEPCFHPNGAQRVLATGPRVLCFERHAPDGSAAVVCATNLSGRHQSVDLGSDRGLTLRGRFVDLCGGPHLSTDAAGRLPVELPPYGVCWLRGCGT
ncbi:MAG: alpha-glucosidase C-terminal domain-containing protein [Euzebyales bacterium]|nr:alpha-glucosidase C-terminal domain-containing protein [Euzebyales bacterium]